MQLESDDIKWIKRGCQKRFLTLSIRKPLASSEIETEARALKSRIRIRDIWFLMKQFEDRNLVFCINRQERTGKLYFWTDYGRKIVSEAIGRVIDPIPDDIEWNSYWYVSL